ncbi:MAG: thioredoxin [Thiotrichales bacterium 32-46-8]|nr:thioredoxin [Gammaproteobacteria bacterium]OYX04866.1 MAG: thioredoxin [Thiotrichales bacterium 32-46-8]OYY23056.1 MAG: thioredoxin [Thiotrichales bacterium 35-46-9]OZA75047.1 MAG: thioredoxin [Thiotrichales bacterium 39-47-5]HQR81684.1 thioredoxin [Thiotrichales bacterium]
MSNSPFIIEATQENFAEILAMSAQKPVLVDFWASWCAPCRQLKPVLEQLAVEYAGAFVLALVNSDEQQALAQQYGIRSLPTIMLFKDGVAVKTEMGAQPATAIRAMLDPYITPSDADNLRMVAKQALAEGQVDVAIDALKQAASITPENYKIHLDLVSIFILQGKLNDALELYKALNDDAKGSKEGKPIGILLSFIEIALAAPVPGELAQQLQANPKNSEALYQLAAYAIIDRQFSDAIEMFLQIMVVDKDWNEGAAKKALIRLFEMLSESHPDVVKEGRRKLQMVLF